MKRYLFSVIGIGLIGGVIEWIGPESEGLRKHLRFLCGLCILCLTVSPLLPMLAQWMQEDGGGEIGIFDEAVTSDYEEVFHAYLQQAGREESARLVQEALCRQFEREQDEIAVRLFWDEEDTLLSADLCLRGQGWLVDPQPLTAYAEELLGCACRIVYDTE